jgi:hypothetical protein
VTGVQTCALPIFKAPDPVRGHDASTNGLINRIKQLRSE